MLGIDARALRVAWTVFLFCFVLAVVYFIRETLILFAVSIFFAYMLAPIVTLVERVMPQRRNLALALVYVLFIAILATVGFRLVSTIAEQATNLASRLPGLVTGGNLSKVPLPGFLEPMRAKVISLLTGEAVNIEHNVVPFIQRAGTGLLLGLTNILPLILVPILGFFLLKDARSIRKALIGSVDEQHERSLLEEILDDVHSLLSKYIQALVLIALAAFVAWLAFLSIMGYSYQFLLAGLAGIMEFIPVVGPAFALVTTLIVYAVTGSSGLLWIIVFWAFVRIFQDYVLSPFLMSSGIELHPLLVLFGVLAGEKIGGIPGAFFSVPVLAIVRAVLMRLRLANRHRSFSPVA